MLKKKTKKRKESVSGNPSKWEKVTEREENWEKEIEEEREAAKQEERNEGREHLTAIEKAREYSSSRKEMSIWKKVSFVDFKPLARPFFTSKATAYIICRSATPASEKRQRREKLIKEQEERKERWRTRRKRYITWLCCSKQKHEMSFLKMRLRSTTGTGCSYVHTLDIGVRIFLFFLDLLQNFTVV